MVSCVMMAVTTPMLTPIARSATKLVMVMLGIAAMVLLTQVMAKPVMMATKSPKPVRTGKPNVSSALPTVASSLAR